MRRSIKFCIVFIVLTGFVFCKEKTNAQKVHIHKIGEAYHIVRQCPMKCEKNKYYKNAGKCPVCKMDLIKIEHEKR